MKPFLAVVCVLCLLAVGAGPSRAQCPGGCRGACPVPGDCGHPGCNCGAARLAARAYLPAPRPGALSSAARAYLPAAPRTQALPRPSPRLYTPPQPQPQQRALAPMFAPFVPYGPGGACPPGRP